MIFKLSTTDPDLFNIRRDVIFDQGVEATVHECLLDSSGDLDHDKICIFKLDEYHAYNSRSYHNPPKVIDNLVIVRCCDGAVTIHMIELRRSRGKNALRRISPNEIVEKFVTAAADFIGNRYLSVFNGMVVKEIKAYLVSDLGGICSSENREKIFEAKVKSSALDAYSSQKPINVLGKKIFIRPVLPPNPIINCC